MEARKAIVCALPRKGIKPQLLRQPVQDVEEDQGDDVEELTEVEYRRAMGYLIRVEEDVEDIEAEFQDLVENLRNIERNSVLRRHSEREQGESSRAKSRRRE